MFHNKNQRLKLLLEEAAIELCNVTINQLAPTAHKTPSYVGNCNEALHGVELSNGSVHIRQTSDGKYVVQSRMVIDPQIEELQSA